MLDNWWSRGLRNIFTFYHGLDTGQSVELSREPGQWWDWLWGELFVLTGRGRWNDKLSLVVAGGTWWHVTSSTCWSRLTDVQPTGDVYRWLYTPQGSLYSLHGYIYYSSPTTGPAWYTDCECEDLKVTDVNLIVIIYYLSLSHWYNTRHSMLTKQAQYKCSR